MGKFGWVGEQRQVPTLLWTFVVMLSVIVNGAAANAQSKESICAVLEQEIAEANDELRRIARDYPGTTVALGSCLFVADQAPRGEEMGRFIGCAGLACTFAGFGNCLAVARDFFLATQKKSNAVARKKELGCP